MQVFFNPVAQYTWNCTTPNNGGQKFIPGIRDLSGIAYNATLNGRVLSIYSMPSLSTDCYGQVTKIEYCYTYCTRGPAAGAIRFNWTLLILSESSEAPMPPGIIKFTVIDNYNIESRPSDENCVGTGPGEKRTCCDTTDMIHFDLLGENFAFAVTESAIGNTHQAALQRSNVAGLMVDTIEQNKEIIQTDSSFATTFIANPNLGLPYLWFIIGIISAMYIVILHLTGT